MTTLLDGKPSRLPLLLLPVLFACSRNDGGGADADAGDSDPGVPAAESPVAEADAVRFLAQATFGPTPRDIRAVTTRGYEVWLEDQLRAPTSRVLPRLAAIGCSPEKVDVDECPEDDERLERFHLERFEAWWQHALYAPDALRQRVAFALSEIFVVSVHADGLFSLPLLVADFYDTLADGAFGSYRDLLEDVTLHPAMGIYLSMVKNPKPNPELGIRPDENYAREVMQLFSIGLVELNPDGTPVLDGAGQPVPTYDQDVVRGMAHALTGWNFAGAETGHLIPWLYAAPKLGRMEPADAFHDQEPKLLVTGFEAPGGLGAEADLELVLDLLAGHPNVGPFLGRKLIQHLVTSNPTPAYVARVSAVFDDDGTGARGNLGAVVRAILLDPEAREGHLTMPDEFGKVREPLLRLTALWRAFDARTEDGEVGFPWTAHVFHQAPQAAPSVFNFFQLDFAPAGPVADAGLVAPELQITTHTFITRTANFLGHMAFAFFVGTDCEECDLPHVDLSRAVELAADVDALVEHLDVRLLGGTMSAAMRETLTRYLGSVPMHEFHGDFPPGTTRAREAVHLVVVSPEFAVQK